MHNHTRTMTADQLRFVLALEEARRGFDLLSEELTRVRDRAGQVLGIGGLAASFLGGLSIRDGASLTAWTWLGIAAFTCLVGLCVAVLWPRKFFSSVDPEQLVRWGDDQDNTIDDMHRDLALRLGQSYVVNRGIVDNLNLLYSAAAIALIAEVVALLLDVRSR